MMSPRLPERSGELVAGKDMRAVFSYAFAYCSMTFGFVKSAL